MSGLKLFVVLLGGKPEGRNIEQHDIFVGAAGELKDLIPEMIKFWPADIHIDAYMALNFIDGYRINFIPKADAVSKSEGGPKLYFINLGGYKIPEFEEFHKKFLVVAGSISEAVSAAKKDPFYTEGQDDTSARSHIDDKEAIDDIICVSKSLENYKIVLAKPSDGFSPFSETKIGYLALSKL